MFLCFILTPFVQFFFFFFTFLHKKSVSHIWQDIRSGVSMGVESLPESQAVWQVSGNFPAFFKVSCTPATWDIPPKSCCMREGVLQGIWLKHIEDNKSRPDSQSRHEPQPHTTATTCLIHPHLVYISCSNSFICFYNTFYICSSNTFYICFCSTYIYCFSPWRLLVLRRVTTDAPF